MPKSKSRPSSGASEITVLRREIGELRKQIDGLVRLFGEPAVPPSPSPVSELSVHFSKSTSERKPYTLELEGVLSATVKLSPIRAALLAVLLVDLQDRLEGGKGMKAATEQCAELALQLDRTLKTANISNVVRVALYRLFDYIESKKLFKGAALTLKFDIDSLQLSVIRTDKTPLSALNLKLSSDDEFLTQYFNGALTASTLSLVRRRRALFVSSGEQGSDRLLLEMYNHPHELQVTSLYVRPPFQSYPPELLKLISVGELVLERKRLAFEGYSSGRFRFTEILQKHLIWDMIRLDENRGFRLYPPEVKKHHVVDHFDNLIYILKTYENYNLHLTDAAIPFALVTYEIRSGVIPEYYSVFFQSFDPARERDLGCFVLSDPHVFRSVTDHIVRWVSAHHSTLRERHEVVRFLQTVRDHLLKRGPLGPKAGLPRLREKKR